MDKDPQKQTNEQSQVLVLKTGEESLLARLSIIHSAQKTLDLQYYAINNDITSNLLIEAVVDAADRGVKVRLLIDDISIGKVQKELSALDCIPNVGVRIFNPINRVAQSPLSRLIAFFSRMPRASRRMHNKAMIADGRVAITGGRNLGDEYFDAHRDVGFKDVDVLSMGPVVAQISRSFADFWGNENSVDIIKLYHRNPSEHYVQKLRAKFEKAQKIRPDTADEKRRRKITLDEFLTSPSHQPVSARCEFLYDDPAKVHGGSQKGNTLRAVAKVAENAREELLVISPYFVPGHGGVAWLAGMRARNVRIGIVTNSLASTDVVAVHTGYRKYRIPLLQYGVEIFELRQKGKRPRQRPFGRTAPSHASLHAKVYVIDRKTGVIGSLNFDPRSARLNTESALVIHSKDIASRLAGMFDNMRAGDSCYRLSLHPSLRWNATDEGRAIVLRDEPDAGLLRRIEAWLIGLMPVEDQL